MAINHVQLRKSMLAFLRKGGVRIKEHGTKSAHLKQLVANQLGITLHPTKTMSDKQIALGLGETLKIGVSKSKKIQKIVKDNFYFSEVWIEVRYFVLRRDGGVCRACGNRGSYGNPLHVDHIKPRSKFPELALEPCNLQVLCRACNLGKRAWDQTDWRTNVVPFRRAGTGPVENG